MSRTILGIDPGTHCGWSVRDGAGNHVSGVIDCAPGRHDSPGMRWIKLRRALLDIFAAYPVDLVAYEDVRRHMGTDAAHIYGGIIAHLQHLCVERGLDHTGIPVGTVKKHATGKGNVGKGPMMEAARAKWPGVRLCDDNEADARWIAETAAAESSGPLDGPAVSG